MQGGEGKNVVVGLWNKETRKKGIKRWKVRDGRGAIKFFLVYK